MKNVQLNIKMTLIGRYLLLKKLERFFFWKMFRIFKFYTLFSVGQKFQQRKISIYPWPRMLEKFVPVLLAPALDVGWKWRFSQYIYGLMKNQRQPRLAEDKSWKKNSSLKLLPNNHQKPEKVAKLAPKKGKS